MLMHQRSDLSRFCLPSHTAVVLVISVPLITRLCVRLTGTWYMLDPPHELPIG